MSVGGGGRWYEMGEEFWTIHGNSRQFTADTAGTVGVSNIPTPTGYYPSPFFSGRGN